MKRALFPGRFQPFHLGHLNVVRKLLEEFDEAVIVIGSAQEGFTCRNPFTASERLEMIDKALRDEGYSRDQYWLIPVPDLHKPLAWTTYVLSMAPRVDLVVSGNPHVLYIYQWLGFSVREIELVGDGRYNGTYIRRTMYSGGDWKSLVPRSIAGYIEEIGGVERVRRLCRDEYGSY